MGEMKDFFSTTDKYNPGEYKYFRILKNRLKNRFRSIYALRMV